MLKSKQPLCLSKTKSSLVKKQPQKPKFQILQNFKGIITNIRYVWNKDTVSQYKIQQKKSQNKKIYYIGGQQYENQKSMIQAHNDIIWFTYRKQYKLSNNVSSDVGWGCLIRVAQMALAQTLKRYFKEQLLSNQIDISYIINTFLQGQQSSKYNILNFVQKGNKYFGKKLGDWYSIMQISIILSQMHKVNPLKGSENFKILHYSNVILLDQIIKQFGSKICQCKQKKIICNTCQTSFLSVFSKKPIKTQNNYIKSIMEIKKNNQKKIMLILGCRLGKEYVKQQNYQILLRLMQNNSFVGCLGGVPKQARFLTGKIQDYITYLDPHYVEKSVGTSQLKKNLNLFHCPQVRKMPRIRLDPDVGICFYLKNLLDLQNLIKLIDQINKSYKNAQIIQYQWQNTYFHQKQDSFQKVKKQFKNSVHKKCSLKRDDSFQNLGNQNSLKSSFIMDQSYN